MHMNGKVGFLTVGRGMKFCCHGHKLWCVGVLV